MENHLNAGIGGVADQLMANRICTWFGTAREIMSNVMVRRRKKLVLIVERDKESLNFIDKLLNRLNSHCEVHRTGDGEGAFASVCSRPPDLIIANPNLFGINGFRFVDNLKMDFYASKIPLILTTGLTRAALMTHLLTDFVGGLTGRSKSR